MMENKSESSLTETPTLPVNEISLLVGMVKTLTETVEELKNKVNELTYEMEEMRDAITQTVVKSPNRQRYESFLKTLNSRQRSTMRQQLRYYTAGVQREPISKEEAYELLLTKFKIPDDIISIGEESKSTTSSSTVQNSIKSNIYYPHQPPYSSTNQLNKSSIIQSIRINRTSIPLNLITMRNQKLLNESSIRPTSTFTFENFVRNIHLELYHAEMMLNGSYADSMTRVIYDVLQLQKVAHDSPYLPWISVITSNTSTKMTRTSFQYKSEEEGWQFLSNKEIENCFNIITREMMLVSNRWRHKQLEDNSSDDNFERVMASMAKMNHVGKGNSSSLETERKKILNSLQELLEVSI